MDTWSELYIFPFPRSACQGQNTGCCTPVTPCDIGEGDCDTGHDCKVGLTCGYNNCVAPEQGRHWFNAGDDCCEPSKVDVVVVAASLDIVIATAASLGIVVVIATAATAVGLLVFLFLLLLILLMFLLLLVLLLLLLLCLLLLPS